MKPLDADTGTDFQNAGRLSASLNATPNLKFERADWVSFRTIEGLQQKAGVPADLLRRLVLKELADNALDGAGENEVRVGALPRGGYFVEDEGPGIDGTPEEIASLFSISRPMVSTKLLRLPTRGALGNGLRVVAGAVLASSGSLVVITRDRRIELQPEFGGTTTVVRCKAVKRPAGTRIEINFGSAMPEDDDALDWAETAIRLQGGEVYRGRSSPHWYDAAHFHELLSASGKRPVRDLVANLDGCTGGKAGEIVSRARLNRAMCTEVSRAQAEKLLQVARDSVKPVSPDRLGGIGPVPGYSYAKAAGTMQSGSSEPHADIPFVVEARARATALETSVRVNVNRTPITGEINAARDKRDIDFYGCGLRHAIATAAKDKDFSIELNVTTPYMPITSDGKEPNLIPFLDEIIAAVGKAVKKATRPSGKDKPTQKDIVLDNLEDVIAQVSGDEGYRFNARQLFYALRPIVLEETGDELKIGNFTTIITNYENEHGEIEGMYREPRGSITHPHRRETITLGTLMVEEYERPEWTFNKLVYIEKEGANEALKGAGWLERHDCAVMSSKGFSSRAARDLIDKLAEHDEPVTVYCVHDADSYGTMIYQTLQAETKARGARKIQIVNLGLEPWEAVEMGLQVETFDEGKNDRPVADYIYSRRGGGRWVEWLQTHRVELNAMTTPQLIGWLDEKMAEHGDGKLIPPADVLDAELAENFEAKVRANLTERILREANLEGRVAEALASIKMPTAVTLTEGIEKLFEGSPERAWRDHIEAVATELSKR